MRLGLKYPQTFSAVPETTANTRQSSCCQQLTQALASTREEKYIGVSTYSKINFNWFSKYPRR
jgi:hypothetical protein